MRDTIGDDLESLFSGNIPADDECDDDDEDECDKEETRGWDEYDFDPAILTVTGWR